ncbi:MULTISPECIES: hypothetical protein [unclassified Gilliamella]|uniref:hypothetical protein n=1 Tax=unclassified Gilliamella TaxID=2685620 RepID=UPI0013216BA1|nr:MULTISPECIES: hypothetical protein [unclassified Gilliamella]MWN32377.1 hypothetical protein [Gilliamella sp. Pra-s60]MWP29619.1 hypothetical protein [Gilliamella sp. Pra-s54]
MLKKCFLLFTLLFCIPTCWADGLTKKQAENLELAGVKLGITEPELIELLKNKHHLSENDFTVSEYQMALPPTKIGEKSIIKGTIKSYEITLNANNQDEKLTITLEDDLERNPIQMVVFNVYQKMTYTAETEQKVYKELTQKYGKEEYKNIVGNKIWSYKPYFLHLSPETDGKFYVTILTDKYRKQKIKS